MQLFIIFLLLPNLFGSQLIQFKVANFSNGEPGSSFEGLYFYVKGEKIWQINYAAGKAYKEYKLSYDGIDKINGVKCFKVRFSNNYTLYVVPKKNSLAVMDKQGNYNKNFSWMYEGPVNGRGTFCEQCVDEDKAVEFVIKYFMK